MTHMQQQTLYEMKRQGLHSQLDTAKHCWQQCKIFKLAEGIHIPILLHECIKKSNQEIERFVY